MFKHHTVSLMQEIKRVNKDPKWNKRTDKSVDRINGTHALINKEKNWNQEMERVKEKNEIYTGTNFQ